MKTQLSAYLNPIQFSVADLHSVKPGLTKHVYMFTKHVNKTKQGSVTLGVGLP